MQMEKAQKLREEWQRKGNPPCDHEHLAKEYALGADTGDYVCTRRGEAGWGRDWNKKKSKK
jgi:hypothetical protein